VLKYNTVFLCDDVIEFSLIPDLLSAFLCNLQQIHLRL